jgi:PAS domain S-box-containing protein
VTDRQFATYYGRLPEPLLLVSPEGRVHAANQSAGELLCIPTESLRELHLKSLVEDSADKLAKTLARWRRTTEFTPASLTWRLPGADSIPTRCDGALADPSGAGAGNLLVRVLPKQLSNARFFALNQKIEQLAREVNERKRMAALLAGQNEVLELIGRRAPLATVLRRLVEVIEDAADGDLLASILLLSEDGAHLHNGAAPSLPEEYSRAVESLRISPGGGSDGTAAYLKQSVLVENIETDPLWAPFRDLALAHNLRACWSTPIAGTEGVLGAFAIYFRTVRGPAPEERRLVEIATRTATIAIERERSDRRLQQSAERQTAILDALPATVALLDSAGNILTVNESWKRFAAENGISVPGSCIGENYLAVCEAAPEDESAREVAEGIREVLNGQAARFRAEYPCHSPTEQRWFRMSVAPVRAPSFPGVGAVIMHVDVTDRKRAEEELLMQASELARTNAELQQFAYVTSHDLREPLRTINSFSQLLERRFGPQLSGEGLEYLDYVREGVRRMEMLIDDLLVYARVVYSRRPERTPIAMGQVVRTALRNLHALIEENGAEVVVGELPVVVANHTQIVQVFQNLIGNAVKYRSASSPVVRVGCEKMGAEWVFRVADNGIGIDEEYREAIFGVFKRLHARNIPGTGIGLALCKKIIEAHGGRVSVESAPGKGSTSFSPCPRSNEHPLGCW